MLNRNVLLPFPLGNKDRTDITVTELNNGSINGWRIAYGEPNTMGYIFVDSISLEGAVRLWNQVVQELNTRDIELYNRCVSREMKLLEEDLKKMIRENPKLWRVLKQTLIAYEYEVTYKEAKQGA